ncbi:phenol 2-monooxygenase [Teratosphaeria destructans]|uniref:Phenol 2-monooxygenase n=1 Tax=Teratosphaeria destructans TaxID=418781 RepID=A0A9W7VZR4_9PEZI|nr:phenol 2-monooxygenase [Teratosphaeria destructans]
MPLSQAACESCVDLLIIGAGPSGLMLAAWASQFNISTLIVDKSPDRVQTGHADGLHSRTLEILDSFGLGAQIFKNCYHVNEICSWNPDPAKPSTIQRTQMVDAQPRRLSRYSQISLSQGAIEHVLLGYLKDNARVQVKRGCVPECLSVEDDDQTDYPTRTAIRRSVDDDAASFNGRENDNAETVRAKYVVGCDGAHSWVRRQVDIPMEGENHNTHFGVMDVVPLTNFPDIRKSCVIHSSTGSVMTVPRENRLVRLYVQMGETATDEKFDRSSVTAEKILAKAREAFHPYTLDFRICDWQSVYTVGQRLAPSFSFRDRVFLCGDAVHTHTPMMGQGMNVSMQDAYNLGWKLGSVLTGIASPEILHTYHRERRSVAKRLIELDREMADFYCRGPSPNSQEYRRYREKFSEFLSGVSITYGPNALVAAGDSKSVDVAVLTGAVCGQPELARSIQLGRRLPSYKVVCQAEANVVQLASMLPSDGKWRLLVFAGDFAMKSQYDAVQDLGGRLQGFQNAHTVPGGDQGLVIEVLLLHAGTREDVDLLNLHAVYHPWDDRLGWDYWKVFSDDVSSFEPAISAYESYGVDAKTGCVVLLRPDSHVSYIGPIGRAAADMTRFLESVFVGEGAR